MRRLGLAVEYGLVFFGLVGVFAWARVPGGPIPVLLVLAIGALFYLRRQPGFDRRDLWRAEALRGEVRPIVLLWCVAAVAGLLGVGLLLPGHLFDLPRQNPVLWAVIVVGYPVFSVYPQELVFRAFLLRRYAELFRTPVAAALGSAAAFGFAHIIFRNWLAVALTLLGGWLFARRFQRSRSLFTVCVEHAAYGLLIFTVGLGQFFYHGSHFGR
jgi:uncharacterized protein